MKVKLVTAAIGLAGFLAATYSLVSVPVYAQTPKTPNIVKVDTVIVQPGDTLSSIATAKQTTYMRLYNANAFIEQPDIIHPGEVIRIPKPDEQLQDRTLPDAGVVVSAAAPVATAQPKPVVTASAGTSVWDQLAMCESGGNWAINTGNGFYGGLQFTLATWAGVGGAGSPNQASREEQVARAQILQARSGWSQWPACTAKLGLR
jgi:LysM repeat protein